MKVEIPIPRKTQISFSKTVLKFNEVPGTKRKDPF